MVSDRLSNTPSNNFQILLDSMGYVGNCQTMCSKWVKILKGRKGKSNELYTTDFMMDRKEQVEGKSFMAFQF